MSIFRAPGDEDEKSTMPVSEFDLTKRYDLYEWRAGEDRLYENVRIVGIRIFKRTKFGSGSIGGYIEIEAPGGARMMIPQMHINMICEHGVAPVYKVLGTWASKRGRKPDSAGGEPKSDSV